MGSRHLKYVQLHIQPGKWHWEPCQSGINYSPIRQEKVDNIKRLIISGVAKSVGAPLFILHGWECDV